MGIIFKVFVFILIAMNCRADLPTSRSQHVSDKMLHFTASAIIAGAAYTAARRNHMMKMRDAIVIGISTAMLAGFFKEATDEEFSMEDMRYNLMGATAGALITYEFE